jgi:hypothetical protein
MGHGTEERRLENGMSTDTVILGRDIAKAVKRRADSCDRISERFWETGSADQAIIYESMATQFRTLAEDIYSEHGAYSIAGLEDS